MTGNRLASTITRRKSLHRVVIGAAAAVAMICAPVEAREPTDLEQFMLELVNGARANPGAEVSRLSELTWGDDDQNPATADLNEGLAAGTIPDTWKQPLAFNLSLIDAAGDYSDTLLANDAFGHHFGGSSPRGRMEAAGYSFVRPWSCGENLAVTANSEAHPITDDRVEIHHANLFIDGGVPGRGHRVNLMDPDWREVGIGIGQGSDYDYFAPPPEYEDLNAVITVQDFAFTSAAGAGAFLTGVAYRDLDSDDFYTPGTGEAIGGLAVDVFLAGTGTPVASTTTYGSGGYGVSLGTGTYDVRFGGGGVSHSFFEVDLTGGRNVKLDAVNPSPEGDVNMDGTVNLGDIVVVIENWQASGDPGPWLRGDADAGGLVDLGDIVAIIANWQASASPGGAAAGGRAPSGVPEPAAIALLALGACLPLRRRRTR